MLWLPGLSGWSAYIFAQRRPDQQSADGRDTEHRCDQDRIERNRRRRLLSLALHSKQPQCAAPGQPTVRTAPSRLPRRLRRMPLSVPVNSPVYCMSARPSCWTGAAMDFAPADREKSQALPRSPNLTRQPVRRWRATTGDREWPGSNRPQRDRPIFVCVMALRQRSNSRSDRRYGIRSCRGLCRIDRGFCSGL
jgi:hypothetical protein